MKWKFSLAQRIRTGGALVVVFLLVIATNMVDSNHFTIVQKSLTTVYEDRLLAKDYIYKISRQLQIKKSSLNNIESESLSNINRSANDSIKSLISIYAQTQLTEDEAVRFESLKNNLDKLINHQSTQPISEYPDTKSSYIETTENMFMAIYEDLDVLSQIQLEESKREIGNSNRRINTSNLISRLEIGVLIVIGLLIQMLIFIKPFK